MIHLRVRTEFSFRRAFGTPERICGRIGQMRATAAAITDIGTWGHPSWSKACKKAGIKPIFGTEIPVTRSLEKTKQPSSLFAFLAKNNDGLTELYELVTKSQEQFYYVPRITYDQVSAISSNIIILVAPGADIHRVANRTNVYLQYTPGARMWNQGLAEQKAWNKIIVADNFFPSISDRTAYEVLAFRNKEMRPHIMHLGTVDEMKLAVPEADDEAFMNCERIATECSAELPTATMIVPVRNQNLRELCIDGALKRRVAIRTEDDGYDWIESPAEEPYGARLDRELAMIEQKHFTDYFHVIQNLVQAAKEQMLVGPARGSSAGSLVCYLLGITDVDPLKHDLLFERFIDVTRFDLPDIDIDFPDDRREIAIQYLRDHYGYERVGRIGTVLRYKAKSTLEAVGGSLGIPPAELAELKRDAGDFFDIAQALRGSPELEKYPGLAIACEIENHASTSGTHAAGIIVTELPVTRYCAIDKSGTAMIDKKDAEAQGMLKIDMLGLRTLSVIQDCLDAVGLDRDWLLKLPLDDVEAFELFNQRRYAGIFQFEGYALQQLCNEMKVREFNDLSALSALGRPGPLHSGSAGDFVARRVGKAPIEYLHTSTEAITQDTLGVIVYQEQFMRVLREIGDMPWEQISKLRRGINQKLGEDEFNSFYDEFALGADKIMTHKESRLLFDRLITFGSYGFNKSHSISYAYLSYWCAVLKSRYPLEFAAATLRNAKDEEQVIEIMRELIKEGYEVVPFDIKHSTLTWSVQNGKLYGGLTNVVGIGASKAAIIMERRSNGLNLTPGLAKALMNGKTPFDNVFITERKYQSYYTDPKAHNILSGKVSRIAEVTEEGEYIIIGRVVDLEVRNAIERAKENSKRIPKGNPLYLMLTVADDTGSIRLQIPRDSFLKLGQKLVELEPVDKFFLWKGSMKSVKYHNINVINWREL